MRRDIVEPLRSHLVPVKDRRDAWWDGDLLIVEYIVVGVRPDRRAFIRAVVRATGCEVIDILHGDRFRGLEPWSMEAIEGLGT